MRVPLVLAAALGLAVLSSPALAASPPGGGRCQDMATDHGARSLWYGRFSGGRRESLTFDREFMNIQTFEACFITRAACERWLYRLKSDYNDWPRWNVCQLGYDPRSRVKSVFEPR